MLLRSNIGIRRDFELPGHPNQIGDGPRTHFAHDAAAVRFDGQVSGAEFAGDLLVQQAGNDQRQDLTLARSQGLEAGFAVPAISDRCLRVWPSRTRASVTASNSGSWRNGFVRNSTAPAFMARTLIGISPCPVRNTMGISTPDFRSSALQIEAAAIGQFDVENQAGGYVRALARG